MYCVNYKLFCVNAQSCIFVAKIIHIWYVICAVLVASVTWIKQCMSILRTLCCDKREFSAVDVFVNGISLLLLFESVLCT